MNDTYINIVIAAAVGSIFTLLVQVGITYARNYRIKKAFNSFLEGTIKVTCDKIKTEIVSVRKEISTYTFNDVSLGMHPNLNSGVLKSFTIDKLYSVYGKKVNVIIDIISILDNLEQRKPYMYFNDFVDTSQKHIMGSTKEEKAIYKTDEQHFLRCAHIETLRRRTNLNLDHINVIIDDLYSNISEL